MGTAGVGAGFAGVLTVIGCNRPSSFGAGRMLKPTTPTMPPMISAPSRMVRGSRTRSSVPGSADFVVRPT